MSFLKFQEGNAGKDLHWSRADRDGAPYRGSSVPLLKEEEFEELSQRVTDTKVGIFDTSDVEQRQHGRTYQEILDGCAAGWFKLLCERQYKWGKRKGSPTMFVYVEWGESYMQLPKSALSKAQMVIPIEDEVSYGQTAKRVISQPRPLRPQTKVRQ